jgi:hypothetical protein
MVEENKILISGQVVKNFINNYIFLDHSDVYILIFWNLEYYTVTQEILKCS